MTFKQYEINERGIKQCRVNMVQLNLKCKLCQKMNFLIYSYNKSDQTTLILQDVFKFVVFPSSSYSVFGFIQLSFILRIGVIHETKEK